MNYPYQIATERQSAGKEWNHETKITDDLGAVFRSNGGGWEEESRPV